MTTESTIAEKHDQRVGYEYLQCKATIENKTNYRLSLNSVDPGMWGKWIQSPTDIPPHGTGHFAAQGRSSSPSGTAGKITYTLVGTDPGAIVTLTFNVPLTGDDGYSISCSPQGAFRVSQTNNGPKQNVGVVTYSIG